MQYNIMHSLHPERGEMSRKRILILHTDMMLRKSEMDEIRKGITKAMKDGTCMIPSGFSYEIAEIDFAEVEQEGKE